MKIVLIMTQSLDGKIGKTSEHIANWSSSADKKAFAAESKKLGVIIMGSSTFETIKRPLPDRLNIILTSRPQDYKEYEQLGVLEFFNGTPAEVVKMLEGRGHHTAALGGGAKTNTAFLQAGLVDEILLSITPVIFGNGIGLFDSKDFNIRTELLEQKILDDNTIQLRYKILK